METQTMQEEFFVLFNKLSDAQKELLFSVAKNFVGAEETPVSLPKEVMDAIWKDREDYTNGMGKNYTREEAREYILRNQKSR